MGLGDVWFLQHVSDKLYFSAKWLTEYCFTVNIVVFDDNIIN